MKLDLRCQHPLVCALLLNTRVAPVDVADNLLDRIDLVLKREHAPIHVCRSAKFAACSGYLLKSELEITRTSRLNAGTIWGGIKMRLLLCVVFMLLTAASSMAAGLPTGFELHKFNPPEQQPVTAEGVTTFHLDPGVCSNVDYGDGRGETDCNGGSIRSIIRKNQNVTLGESVEYRFDVRVDPAITYTGFKTMAAIGIYPEGIDSHLRIASWEGPAIKNFIYMVKVSKTHGIEFLANQCQAPDNFGEWVTFSLKTHWAADSKGWVVVSCDGKVIYADEGVATNQAPHCYQSNECEPWVPKNAKNFNFALGPVMMGFGPDWAKNPAATSKFDTMQPDGITIQMRNISVTPGAKLYDAASSASIKALQELLAGLGCDPGPIDGIPGKKTRDAALSCRAFPEGKLPTKLTVATVQTFVELYQSPEAASLPIGILPLASTGKLKADFVVHAAEEGAFKAGRDVEVNSNIFARVEGAKKGQNELFFIMLGRFDFNDANFSQLEFILQDALTKDERNAVTKCGGSTIAFPDGTIHVQIQLRRPDPTKWVGPAKADCIAAALPKTQAAQMDFLLDHFKDLAIGMVNDQTVDKVRHEGVQIFMRRVALGDIAVGRN